MSRTTSYACLAAAVWALAVSALLDIGLAPAATFIALSTGAAFGIGYDSDDGGAAPALFLMLAGFGSIVILTAAASGIPGAWTGLVFAIPPALIAAVSAHAGGSLRERRQT